MPNRIKADRAKQFLPFDSLKGLHEALRQKEKIVVPKIELSDDEVMRLSAKLAQVHKGMMVKVVYFHRGEYLELTGMVSMVDTTDRFMRIVKTKIYFADLRELTGPEIHMSDF